MDLGLKQAFELMVVILVVALLFVLTGNLAKTDGGNSEKEHGSTWAGARAIIPSKPKVIYEKADEYTTQGRNYWDGTGTQPPMKPWATTEPANISMIKQQLPTPYKKGDRYEITFEAKSYSTAKNLNVQFGKVEDETPWSYKSEEEEKALHEKYMKQVLSRIDDKEYDRVNEKSFSLSNEWIPYSFTIEIGDADGGQADYAKELNISYRESLQKTDKVGVRNVKITKIK